MHGLYTAFSNVACGYNFCALSPACLTEINDLLFRQINHISHGALRLG